MQSILLFNLPEDRDEYIAAVKGMDYYLSFWDITQWLREQIKYNAGNLSNDAIIQLERIQEEIFATLAERNIDLNEIS